MKKIVIMICVFVAFDSVAQEQKDDPILEQLYNPEYILGNHADIQLTDNQRQDIKAEMLAAQSEFIDLSSEMSTLGKDLAASLSPAKVDEEKALQIMDEILTTETVLKKRKLQLMIRIKNILTEEQQIQLDELRNG